MTSIPFQYDSLRTVIQYLEPNLRFILSQRIPSLRSVEKAAPLKINTLKFGTGTELTVNDTKYRFGIYRDYPDRLPRYHHYSNLYGGLWIDLDQWGFNDNESCKVLIPGDVVLPRLEQNFFDDLEDLEDPQNFLERHVDFFKKAIADRIEKGEELVDIPEIGPLLFDKDWDIELEDFVELVFETPEEQMIAERAKFEQLRNEPIGRLQLSLQGWQTQLDPYYCRLDNTQPSFTPKLQLTVASLEKTEIFRFRYNMKLHEAMQKMCTQFFGNRRCAINLSTLDTMNAKIIRLPLGLKLRIRKLRCDGPATANYESLKHVIDELNDPLDELDLNRGLQNQEDVDHQIVQSSKKLKLTPGTSSIPNFWLMFLKFRNPTIEVHSFYFPFPIAHQVQLIQDWIQTGRPVGSTFSHKSWQLEPADDLITQIRENFALAIINDSTATIPMAMNRQLLVRYNKETLDFKTGIIYFMCFVQLEVVDAE